MQSVDPTLLALQTANIATQNAKKKVLPSLSTQAIAKPSLNIPTQQPQAISTPPITKIGGISSSFGATNINSSPVLWWATPTEIKETATQLQSLPKAMPKTGITQPDMTQSLKDLKATIPSMQSIDDIKGAFPEFSDLEDSVLLDLVETTKNSDNYEDILWVFPELQWWQPTTTKNIAWWLIDTAKKVWWGILWAVTWWLTLYGAWAATEKIWKWLYWLTLPPTQREAEALQSFAAWTSNFKPKTALDTALEAPIISWNPLKSKSYWMLGTRWWIWIQAEAKANDIFKNTIQPILNKAKTSNTTINVQWAIKELWNDIIKLAKWDPDKLAEYKQAFDELVTSFQWDEFKNMSLDKLQELKSWLQDRTPNKYFKGNEITNAYWELRAKLSTKLTWKLHSAIEKDFWTKSAELYKDYANMKQLSEIWPKARTMWWLKWWFGWFWSTLSDTALTPVTTTAGKITYKLWWLVKALPTSLLKWVTKWIKSIIKSWSIFTVLSDWTLIPWSPSNLADIAMSTPKEDRVYIKWSDMRLHKDQFKYDKNLKMNVAQTDLWMVDEKWNVIN